MTNFPLDYSAVTPEADEGAVLSTESEVIRSRVDGLD